ncbi:MAG TPA: hypothetical protein VHU41_13775 [Thermoanaerobaculia bacterium]|nr:hypothetical protein [Thermoanaerobaculia bacterium]
MAYPFRTAALVFTAMFATSAFADALGEVRTALQRMTASEPLHAVVQLDRSRHSHGRFLNDDFDGSVMFEVDEDANGIRVSYSRSLLQRATNEDWAKEINPARGAGTRDALSEAQPRSIETAVDAAGMVLHLVNRGHIVEQKIETVQGRPERMLLFHLPATDGAEPGVSTTADNFTLWIGADGLPVAAKRERKGSAGVLFIHVNTVRTETWTFAARGDHLVAMRFDDRSTVDGPGQHGDAHSTWSVR